VLDFSDFSALVVRGHDGIILAANALRWRVLAVAEGRDATCLAIIATDLTGRPSRSSR
jgi:hypothetical protein